MPVYSNISLVQYEARTVAITVSGGMSGMSGAVVVFQARARWQGESGLIVKSLASGYIAAESGLTLTNSNSGTVTISFATADTSGLISRGFVWDLTRTTSGRTVTNAGYLHVLPAAGTP